MYYCILYWSWSICPGTKGCTICIYSSTVLYDLVQAVFDAKLASGALNQARVAKSSVLAKNLVNVVGR